MPELKLKQKQFKDRFDRYLKQLGAVGDDVYSRCADFLVMGYRLIIQDAYSERKVDLADTYQTFVFNCSQKDYLDILTNANPKNNYYSEICDLYADYSTQLGEFCQQIIRNIKEYNYINVEATYEVMDEYREHMKDFAEFVLGEPAGLPVINFANTIEDRIIEMMENAEFDTPAMPAPGNEKAPDSRETLMVEPELDGDDAVYEYCSVIFKHGNQSYAYLTGGIQVEVGDTVIVPVGPDQKERKATVVSVGKYMRIVAPYPPEKTRTIMRVE